jgi:NhaA family Na+:H+ antiporter
VRSFGVYTAVGIATWFGFHESGVHATIAGVLLGLLTPARSYLSESTVGRLVQRASDVLHGGEWAEVDDRSGSVRQVQRAVREVVSPLEYLEGILHPWTSFLIMPVFALANAGVPFTAAEFKEPVALAVMAGLIVGKPLGIVLASYVCVKLITRRLPDDLRWSAIFGGSCLAGIGFTMALFIADLALADELLDAAKVGVLSASAIAMVLGLAVLFAVTRPVRPASRGTAP